MIEQARRWIGAYGLGTGRQIARRLAAIVAARLARRRSRAPRTVVFVTNRPRGRERKLAFGLRSIGWNVVLLHLEPLDSGMERYFSRIERFRDPTDALRIASRYAPMAYHVFCLWDFFTARLFVRHRPGKIVLDNYEYLGAIYRREFVECRLPGATVLERECLEQSDALCCRDLQLQIVKRELGYRLPRPRILILDGCWADDDEADGARPEDGSVHVVHCGTVHSEASEPEIPGGHFLYLAEALARDRIHFHLHPAPGPAPFEQEFSAYLDLEKSGSFVHVHRPLSPEQVPAALRSHTFGLHVSGSNIHVPANDPCVRRCLADSTLAGRLFDFIDAGIYTLTHDGRFQRWFCARYGVGEAADRQLVENPSRYLRSRLPDEQTRNRLREARQRLDIRRHAPRLAAFYESLYGLKRP